MESKDVHYNFQTNLLKASSNPNYDEAIKEWRRLYRESREVSDLPCICNHKIRHCTYMYNVITKFAIIVGSTCYKKFKLSIPMIKILYILKYCKMYLKKENTLSLTILLNIRRR